ncbi:MAG TPA: RDD family protein [Thermoanaerobaculia bacterium]|nr:RDD family protein [Thermoanaerobaculia bacterium]
MRRARLLAFFLDTLVCAVPADLAGLLLTGAVWRFVPRVRGAVPAIWAAAGAAATVAFLLRDARGGRARRWLAMEVRRVDGRPPGAWGSVRRNLPLLVPLWNLWDVWPLLRDRDAQRRTDRRTGIRMLRIT